MTDPKLIEMITNLLDAASAYADQQAMSDPDNENRERAMAAAREWLDRETDENLLSEKQRYFGFLLEELAEHVDGWERTMHPDFGLTDADAIEVMGVLAEELRDNARELGR